MAMTEPFTICAQHTVDENLVTCNIGFMHLALLICRASYHPAELVLSIFLGMACRVHIFAFQV